MAQMNERASGRRVPQGLAVVGDTVEAVIVADSTPVTQFAAFQHTSYQLCRIALRIELLLVNIPKEVG